MLDSFRRDPWGGLSMVATAERVAAEGGMSRESINEVALLRYQQYQAALANDRAFQRAYMTPVALPSRRGEPLVIEGDVGIHPTSAEGLAKLAPGQRRRCRDVRHPDPPRRWHRRPGRHDGRASAESWQAGKGSPASSAQASPVSAREKCPKPRFQPPKAALDHAGLTSR